MTFVTRSHLSVDQTQSSLSTDSVHYPNLDVRHDEQDRTFWCFLKPSGRPSFTQGLLLDLHRVQGDIRRLAGPSSGPAASVGWVVLASRSPGVFSLGGDLTLFASKIQAGDHQGLREYAYSCVDIAYQNSTGYENGAVSIGLAQGEALGVASKIFYCVTC